MRLSVLPTLETPAYKQIAGQITAQILSGELPAGFALPPIRTVAKELGVSVITVRGAWELLEADGLIETRAGSGCYVAALSPAERDRRRSAALAEPLAALVAAAKALGYTADETARMVKEEWRSGASQ